MSTEAAGIYLDNAATSWPKPPGVLRAIEEFFANAGGNVGRAGHRRSIASSRSVSLARERVADLLGAETPDQVVFTKNATEGLNLAILGLVAPGSRVVTARSSTTRSCGRCGVSRPAASAPSRSCGGRQHRRHRPRRVGGRFRAGGPCVAVVMHASNVTGVLLPIGEIAARAADAGVPLIVDASQSAGHYPLDVASLGAAAVAMPGHKGLLGPTGTGLLYLAQGSSSSR